MTHLISTHRRVLCLLATLLLLLPLAGFSVPSARPAEEQTDKDQTKKPAEPGTFDVHFTDDSHLKVRLRDEKIELVTAYGTLQIPTSDIRRIDFATRISDELSKRINTAVGNLSSQEFKTREAATVELTTIGAPSYPTLLKAARSPDAEVGRRAEDLLTKLRAEVPEDQLAIRANDVIYTDTSKIAGHIQTSSLKVFTAQFGDQPMKLWDVRCLYAPGAEPETAAVANVETPPDNLMKLQANIGKTYVFRVTGSMTGSLWGTDVYTSDSSLEAAAVHAGVLRPGQTGVVKVTFVAPPATFTGSTRHGVTSSAYFGFPGAFKVAHK
jgi:hypothetical protein